MPTFETIEAKVARRGRYHQHRGKKTTRNRGWIARHWDGPFRDGGSVKQPEALDHHGHRQIDHRGLVDARTWLGCRRK